MTASWNETNLSNCIRLGAGYEKLGHLQILEKKS